MSFHPSVPVRVNYCRLGVPIIHYDHEGDSGFGLHAMAWRYPHEKHNDVSRLIEKDGVAIPPLSSIVIFTGIRVALPSGYELYVRGRSGKANQYLFVVPGTVDASYRGEVGAQLHNAHARTHITIKYTDKVAQAVLSPVVHMEPEERATWDVFETTRREGGYGSTGD